MIGDHDQHGHDPADSSHANQHGWEFSNRFNWDDPTLDAKRGGEPATCGVCHAAPWWILSKVPGGGRRPTCSRCFTAHALKRDRLVVAR